MELAGNKIGQFPHFEYVRAINEGTPIQLGIDVGLYPALLGQKADLYVCKSQTIAQWTANPALFDVTAAVETHKFLSPDITSNIVQIENGLLGGGSGVVLGVPFDVVIDVNQNGKLDAPDFIDGYDNVEAGCYVVHDTTAPGPYPVTELIYDLSMAPWDEQNLYYPTVAFDAELPLIVISHGNGHNYQWYDHIGYHMASYGYVVMSHANQTGPGVNFAASTTLSNTDDFFDNLSIIAGGVLDGRVSQKEIVWLGHSRGGEGVVIAYDRIVDGTHVPIYYAEESLQLISSIAPTDFLTLPDTDPHGVNYHLWTGGSDSDVNGCASCNLCQTFHLHDRAQQFRQSISLHGVGHGDFHDGGGNPWATGPCLVGTPDTHQIMRGYFYPLVERYVNANIPAKDFLTRQWESFQPIGAPVGNPCVVVDLMYRDGKVDGKFIVDDYQSNPAVNLASSGLSVFSWPGGLVEGDLDDNDFSFTDLAADPMNGMTVNGDGADDSAGVVMEWNNNGYYLWYDPSGFPLSKFETISFRACQVTRDANTTAALGDLTFDFIVYDTSGVISRIDISAFGGGVEEPYQRSGCGAGVGWANEFETIRLPVDGFAHEGTGVDLDNILLFGLQFGPSYGSPEGRIGVDDVELLAD
ncbi:MAG: alpha/beta hydrolase [Planctomycetota bacterium]